MQLSSDAQIPEGLLAANVLLSEKPHQGVPSWNLAPHQGVPSWNLAPHQGINERNSTVAIGLRAGLLLNRVESRYTGKERDTESGLDYFGARYYASSMGRWMSPDWAEKPEAVPYSKLDNPQTLNLYGYVNNNPLSMADPDGHCCWDEAKQWVSDHPRTMQAAKGVGQVTAGVGVMFSGTAEAASGGTATVGVIFAVQGSVATGVMGVTNILGAATKTDVSASEKPLAAVANPAGQIVTAATGSVDKGAQAAAIGDALVTGANIKDLGEGSKAVRAIKTVQAAQSAKEGVQAVREIQHPVMGKKA